MASSQSHQLGRFDNILQEENGGWLFLPKGLDIIWGRDGRYWSISDYVAELLQVSWLEVSGSFTGEPGICYGITFQVSFRPDAFGWGGTPVYLMAKVGKRGQYRRKMVNFWQHFNGMGFDLDPFDVPEPQPLYIQIPPGASDTTIFFGLYEVWSGKWKGGLRIHSATVERIIDATPF